MANLQIQAQQTFTPAVQSKPQQAQTAEKARPQVLSAESLSTVDRADLQTYTVKAKDNLWNISKDQLGNATQWKQIFELNKTQIKDPDLIFPDQELTLPVLKEKPVAPPVQAEPPAQPPAPVVEQPPAQPAPIVDEPPAQIAPPQAPQQPAPVDAPPVIEEPPAQVTQPEPQTPPPSVVNPDGSPSTWSVGKAAAIGGAIGVVGTSGALIATTATLAPPLSNLGGYATAQKVVSGINRLGFKLPSGPALSQGIKAIGGPKVAGAATAIGVGLAAAGIAAGSYYLYQKFTD